MWDLLVVDPMINMLLFFYKFVGQQTVVAVALVTLAVRLLLTPLTLNQQKTAGRQQALQPKMKELQEKYKNDKERLAQEQMSLYREMGINPMSGCLGSLIQLPLMIGLYQAIIRTLAATPLGLLDLPQHIYNISWLDLSGIVPLNSQFLWLDLALPDPYFVLPILVGVTSWLMQKMLTPPSADPQTQSMTQSMQITMPLFMTFISLNYASGLSVYFVISNLVGILQFYLFRNQYAMARGEDQKAKKGKKKTAPATSGATPRKKKTA